MNCVKCSSLLSPYLLRQVQEGEGHLLFEIECPNPHCRFLNMVSKEFYFHSKKDFISQTRMDLEFTTKLPGEANVIFVSMDRCGISWIVRRLSRLHEEMFGVEIEYSPELSRIIATRPRFPLPKGWYCVYDVDPHQLLDRGYDKIVSIQRPLEIMYRVLSMYYMPKLSYKKCRKQYPAYFTKIDEYYETVYGKINEIKDERYINFTLPSFNNRTEATFLRLMDFLNFPKKGRPVIFPINPPDRNWQAWSTTLGVQEPIGQKLLEMQSRFGDIFGKDEKDINDFLRDLDQTLQAWEIKREKKIRARLKEIQEQYEHVSCEIDIQKNFFPPAKFRQKRRVIRIVPHESRIQGQRKFRLYAEDVPDALDIEEKYDILVLGPIGHSYGCHMSELMTRGFVKLGHRILFISQKIFFQYGMREPQKISTIIKRFLNNKKPDFIFLSEMRVRIINDLGIPMAYFQTGWYSPPNVEGDHIIHYFRQSQIVDAYRKEGRIVETMYSCVDPEDFYPETKSLKGVFGIGFRKTWTKWFSMVKSLKPLVALMKKETDHFIKLGFQYFPTPVDDLEYRDIMRKIEALNPLTANGGYITRRVLEGMACKTLIIMRLDFVLKDDKRDSSIHRNMLREMGYYAGVHYIEIDNAKDIKGIWKDIRENEKEKVRENAYKLTLERHTPINRAKQIIDDFESGRWKKAIYNPDNEGDAERRETAKQARIKETLEIEDLVIK